MTDLRTIQQALHQFLQGKASDIYQYVVGKNPAEIKRRLAVYQEGYQLRLEENLRKQYPVLCLWLGGKKFTELALAYDQAFPPTDCAIRYYAQHMPAYFQARAEDFLFDLTVFEWAMNTALDSSSDALLLTPEDFQKITPEALLSITFQFHPSLQFLTLHYDIPTFWRAAQKSKPSTPPAYSADPLFQVAVWRKNTQVYFRTLTALEAELLTAAQQKENFSDLCARAAISSDENEAVNFVAQTVLRWLKDGWLVVEE